MMVSDAVVVVVVKGLCVKVEMLEYSTVIRVYV